MSTIFKTLAVLTIVLSFTFTPSNGYEVDMIEVLTLAEKLTDLFKAISNTKISLNEQQNIFKLQGSLMTAWKNIMNALNNIESSKTIDAYIALIKNQQDLVSQLISVFNIDRLIKFSVTVADTIKSVNENENTSNCNSTNCIVNFLPNIGINTIAVTNSTTAQTMTTTLLQNATASANTAIKNGTTTKQPFNTTIVTTVSIILQNSTSFNTNVTTSKLVTTTVASNYTIIFPNTSIIPQNFTSNETITNSASTPASSTAIIPSTQNQVYIDSEFCQFYTLSDCASRIEISLLCPAMCRCSKFNCKNNGTLALSDDGQCRCLCRPEFTGDNCDEPVCTEKEYCSYFNDSYCTVTMIEDNCPVLCGKCK